MKKINDSFMASLIAKICKRLNLNLLMGPKMGAYGQIKSKNKRISFYNCCFDVNSYGSSIFSRNKGLTRSVLEKEGILMLRGKYFSFDTDEFESSSKKDFIKKIINFANTLTFPIMVKGADLHRGTCIFKVESKKELIKSINKALDLTHGVVVEKFIDLPSYRVLIFDGKVIACYKKEPFQIVGDGKLTAYKLIEWAKKRAQKESIGTCFRSMDVEICNKLKESGYEEDSIIPFGKKIVLTDSASISRGGRAVDYTDHLSVSFKQYCKKVCKLLNLRLCGIDVVSENISKAPRNTYLLEVNSSPCLETYSLLGKLQQRKIENLMEKIIKEGLINNGF